jgi:hypothetical protein
MPVVPPETNPIHPTPPQIARVGVEVDSGFAVLETTTRVGPLAVKTHRITLAHQVRGRMAAKEALGKHFKIRHKCSHM